MTSGAPGVTVIIPTVGRADLARAISSVRAQDYTGLIEIIIVADMPENSLEPTLTRDGDLVLYTGGAKRGGAARNLGISSATQLFTAFLDDDDEWLPWKLSHQMQVFMDQSVDVVGTRSVYRNRTTGRTSAAVPAVPLGSGQSVSEYLFRGRRPRAGRPVIYTSTLVAKTELARRIPWDGSLRRHQDWDWLDRLERGGAKIIQLWDASAVIWTGSCGSVSSSSDWESSLAWAESNRDIWEPETLADFLAGQPMRYALQAHSLRGIRAVSEAILNTHRLPAAGTMALGLTGLVPRSLINRALSR